MRSQVYVISFRAKDIRLLRRSFIAFDVLIARVKKRSNGI